MAVGVFIRSDKVALKGRHPLFSRVRQTFRQLPLLSQASTAYLLRPLPPRHQAGPRGGGAGWVPWAKAGGDALRKPLSNEGPESGCRTPKLALQIPAGHLLGHHLLSSPFNCIPQPSLSSVTSVSYLSGHQFSRLSVTSPKDLCRTLVQERRPHRP